MKKLLLLDLWLIIPNVLFIAVSLMLLLIPENENTHITYIGKWIMGVLGGLSLLRLCFNISHIQLLYNKYDDILKVDEWRDTFNKAVQRYHSEAEKFKNIVWQFRSNEEL